MTTLERIRLRYLTLKLRALCWVLRAETVLEMMRAELAELEDHRALGVVKPGALQRAGLIRDLLALPLITRIIEHLAARGERGQDWGSA
jgi:hypothetical protein